MRGAQITAKDVAEAPLHAMQILRHQLLCGRRLGHILPTKQRSSADPTRQILSRNTRISSSSINSIELGSTGDGEHTHQGREALVSMSAENGEAAVCAGVGGGERLAEGPDCWPRRRSGPRTRLLSRHIGLLHVRTTSRARASENRLVPRGNFPETRRPSWEATSGSGMSMICA